MKPTDLMIGDWISVEGKVYARVIRLMEFYIDVMTTNGTEIHTTYDAIKPIHVTDEIMAANGWKLINFNLHRDWYYRLPAANYPFYIVKSGFAGTSPEERFTFSDDFYGGVFFRFTLVHEVQHALRLCYLDEFADRFSLEEK